MKTGLALSGGGVLGVAHVGVLRQLELNNVKIDLISGTSAGAIIGSLFATGGFEMVQNFIEDIAAQGLFERKSLLLKPLPDKIFITVQETLRTYLPSTFEELKTNFICTVTNFAEGKPEYITSGRLVEAVMASSAFPGVFPAQDLNGKSLIDGGITVNLPATILRKNGTDFVIGSSLYNIVKMEEYNVEGNTPSRFLVLKRAIDIMQQAMAESEVKVCDYCFAPPIEVFNWFDLERMTVIRQIGEDYAKRHFPELLAKLNTKPKKGLFAKVLRQK